MPVDFLYVQLTPEVGSDNWSWPAQEPPLPSSPFNGTIKMSNGTIQNTSKVFTRMVNFILGYKNIVMLSVP